jgi:hypothetical protein
VLLSFSMMLTHSMAVAGSSQRDPNLIVSFRLLCRVFG